MTCLTVRETRIKMLSAQCPRTIGADEEIEFSLTGGFGVTNQTVPSSWLTTPEGERFKVSRLVFGVALKAILMGAKTLKVKSNGRGIHRAYEFQAWDGDTRINIDPYTPFGEDECQT